MCRPAGIEAGLRNAPRPRPPGRDHLGPVPSALVTEKDLLVAGLPDPLPDLVEGGEDDIDVGPVGRTRDDQGHALDLRLRRRFPIVLLEQLLRLEDGARLLGAEARPRSGCRDEGMPRFHLVALGRGLAHRLDGAHDLAELQEASLRLFERGLGDLRSVMALRQRADLVGGPVQILPDGDLAALQDCCEPVRERFDLRLKPGVPQLPEEGLEGFPDDVVGQDVVFRDRQFGALLRQAVKFDDLVGVRLVVSHGISPDVRLLAHHGSVVAWPYVWFPKLTGSGTAEPPACRAQKFSGHIPTHVRAAAHWTDAAPPTAVAEKFCDP